MRDLPIVARSIINVILYILYVVVISFAFGILFPLLLQVFGKAVMNPADPMFAKIQIFIAVLVLLVSLILRKHFYVLGYEEGTEVIIEESYTAKKKEPSKKTKKTISIEENNDDEIKIYVDKEIK